MGLRIAPSEIQNLSTEIGRSKDGAVDSPVTILPLRILVPDLSRGFPQVHIEITIRNVLQYLLSHLFQR